MPTALPPPAGGTHTRALLGVLALTLLLVAFERVVQAAVRQGEARRRATALLADATWRCKALHERASRANCLFRLQAPNEAGAAPPEGAPPAP